MTTTTSNPPVVRPNEAAARSQRVADARSAFRQIKIVHPRQEAIIAGLDEVRRSGIATRGERQYGITLLTESGSGKTTAAEHFRDGIERLGDASLLYVQIPGQLMATVKVEGSAALAAGSALTLRLMPDQLHLFDSQGIACHRTVELPE